MGTIKSLAFKAASMEAAHGSCGSFSIVPVGSLCYTVGRHDQMPPVCLTAEEEGFYCDFFLVCSQGNSHWDPFQPGNGEGTKRCRGKGEDDGNGIVYRNESERGSRLGLAC
ncbi:MAG: hypothetical protein Q4D60_05850 [Eubacteriales bacterium]|nr:hypothetical protein [Eubacteriales bacterium]